LELAQKEFNVDPQRTYLMGHSMGGSGTWHLGMKYPEKWAALSPLASAGTNHDYDMKKLKGQLGVIVVHGVTHKYLEFPNGTHLNVAWEHFPEVFDLFQENVKQDKQETVKQDK
jgi:pimeloyl-ACP methyl ester carboxylesterase|tara:strand:- start:673 stop:1014 length:342 start_codon:yes stop_codon:yes gene_type:complete